MNKIFIIDDCDIIPSPSGDTCPIMANIIEACDSDNTIILASASTIFNKTIVGENLDLNGKIIGYGNSNINGKILSGTTTGFELVDFPTIKTDDFYTTGATLSNNVISFNRNDMVSAYSVDLSSYDNSLILISLSAITTQNTINIAILSGITQSIISGFTDTYVTGGTYSNGVTTFRNNTGGTFSISGYSTFTGITFNNVISALGYTPYNATNPNGYISGFTDTYVTGGTYVDGTTTFTNNTGGTFTISGYLNVSTPFVQEANGSIHRADTPSSGNGIFSTDLTNNVDSNTGDYSHSDSGGKAFGDYSHANGNGVIANSFSETAVGIFNEVVTPFSQNDFDENDLAFSVGIGNNSKKGRRLTSFSAYKNGSFKFISRALTNITNQVKGFFAFDEDARPNTYDGSKWNKLAYLSEISKKKKKQDNNFSGYLIELEDAPIFIYYMSNNGQILMEGEDNDYTVLDNTLIMNYPLYNEKIIVVYEY